MLRPVLVPAFLAAAVVMAGCTDSLSFSSASLDDPSFTIEPATGGRDTVFRVDAGKLSSYNVTWDWGDGVLTYGGASEHKYGFTNGVMTVTLIATDVDGRQGIATREVVLGTGVNRDPTASVRVLPRAWVEVGQEFTLAAGGSDPDRDPLTYLWTWEPAAEESAAPPVVISTSEKTAKHSFDAPGRYLVKVQARDPKGGMATAQTHVDVSRKIPASTFEAVFNGTIRAGTMGAGVSDKAWVASPPAPDTEIDAVRHAYTLQYPASTVILVTWNDTSTVGVFDLDLELRNAQTNETVFRSQAHAVNPDQPGPPTPLPPIEFNMTAQAPGTYWVIIHGWTGVDVKYSVLVYASLQLTPELVAMAEG